MNQTTPVFFHLLVRCIDDSPAIIKKPVKDWIKKGELYTVYSFENPINTSGELPSFFIKDKNGRKLEPFDGVPTFRGERFRVEYQIFLN